MFVVERKVKDKVYVYLEEAVYKDGKKINKIVKSFGDKAKLPEGKVEELKAMYKNESNEKRTAEQKFRLQEFSSVMNALNTSSQSNTEFAFPELNYGHIPLRRIWKEILGLDYKIDYLQENKSEITAYKLSNIASFVAALKVIDPSSYLQVWNNQSNYLLNPINGVAQDNIYSALDYLNKFKDDIFEHAVKSYRKHFKLGMNPRMIYFDCTNCYYETMLDDQEQFIHNFKKAKLSELLSLNKTQQEIDDYFNSSSFIESLNNELEFNEEKFLRMKGPSKEGRFSLPIVGIALVVDENAVPIDYEVFTGNQSEFKEVPKIIKSLKDKYQIKNSYFVADRGLNSTENLDFLLNKDIGFVVAQKVSNLPKNQEKFLLSDEGWIKYNFAENKFAACVVADEDDSSFKYKVNNFDKISFIDVKDENGETHKKKVTVKCKVMYTFSEARKQRDLIKLQNEKVKAQKAIDDGKFMGNPYGTGWRSIILTQKEVVNDNKKDKEMYRAVSLNLKAIAKKEMLAGYAAVVYQDPENIDTKITEQEVLNTYKSLVKIEDCFRILKSNIAIRPLRVRTDKRIKAHTLICILSLMIIRIIQIKAMERQVNLSPYDISRALKSANVVALPMKDNDYLFIKTEKYQRLSNVDKEAQSIDEYKRGKDLSNGQIINLIFDILNMKPLENNTTQNQMKACLKIGTKDKTEVVNDDYVTQIMSKLR